MTGVVVCHGSPVVRERLVAAAQSVPALTPVRAAASGEELLLLARRQVPSVVLLDAHLPGTGPVEAMRRLRLMNIGAAVVMLAQPGDEIALDRAISLGARGFVAPDVGRAELAVGIRTFWWTPDRAGRTGPADPHPGTLRFGTGAGITWGSDPAAEWAETELKARRLIGLASAPD